MKRFVLLVIILFSINLFAVHNFTLDGEDSATVSVGDSINVFFEFEEIGSSASISIEINLAEISLPAYDSETAVLIDGGPFDTTPVDGVFAAYLPIFASAPEAASVVITLTDNDISDSVQLSFVQLDSDFSLSGNITQENSWMDLPVPGALVYTLYNAGIDQFTELVGSGNFEQILELLISGHYLLTDITMLLGTYQIFIPDEIPDVSCITGVFSMLNTQDTHIAPTFQENIINGHISNIDFHYAFAAGVLNTTILDEFNLPIENAIAAISTEGQTIPTVFTTDENGQFSVGLANGDYAIIVTALGYEIYTSEFTISDANLDLEIKLDPLVDIDNDEISQTVYHLSNYPNPFTKTSLRNLGTTISFELSNNYNSASIEIYNIKGQNIKRFDIQNNQVGLNNILWDGKDNYNRAVPSGIYFYKLSLDGKATASNKMLIIK